MFTYMIFAQEEIHQHFQNTINVHQNMTALMQSAWQCLKESTSDNILLEAAHQHIHQWINEIDLSNFDIQEEHRQKFHDLLFHPNWQAALNYNWSHVENNTIGAHFLSTSVALCLQRPEYRSAFLIQGLWSSITAYSNDEKNPQPSDISCTQGVFARLVLWYRNATPFA